jgi:hypothetical protein
LSLQKQNQTNYQVHENHRNAAPTARGYSTEACASSSLPNPPSFQPSTSSHGWNDGGTLTSLPPRLARMDARRRPLALYPT